MLNSHRGTSTSTSFRSAFLLLALATSLASVGCGDWAQFGNGPINPHNSHSKGPEMGLSFQANLLPGGASPTFGLEVGVLVDIQGDYYVSSQDPEIQVYDHAGNWMGVYNFGFSGPRAVPFVDSRFNSRYSTIFTGAVGGSGGFHAINVNKATVPYTLTAVSDPLTGPSQSSPKRAKDRTLYICDVRGTVHRYRYAGGVLTHLASIALGHEVKGAIALYDADPQYREEEVLVATTDGRFYVLAHDLSSIIWSDISGVGPVGSDNYYAGVTVGERGSLSAVALLPIALNPAGLFSPNSGKLRAIDLQTQTVAWELAPSNTAVSQHAIPGSVAILFDQGQFTVPGNSTTTIDNNPPGGILEGGNTGTIGTIDIDDGLGGVHPNSSPYHATFASTDRYLYGVDIVTGLEIWNYPMSAGGYDAPVVDATNIIYVGDGRSILHAVEGKISCAGCGIWANASLATGGGTDIVKLGITNKNALAVGHEIRAEVVFQ